MLLGQGSYGEVKERKGKAIKTFPKVSYLIQEYMALRYLSDCSNVVHTCGVDFAAFELHMDLYDCSLRKWLDENRSSNTYQTDILVIMRDILLGLVELHDRDLAHGDLKPGNVLIKKSPLRAVLGDCGFVSVAKYAKVDRTAPIYRDPIVSHEPSHDMFSFGVCFMEMYGEIKISRQATYTELKELVRTRVEDRKVQKILYNLLHEDKSRRPDSRELLLRMFGETPEPWIRPNLVMFTPDFHGGRVQVGLLKEDINIIRRLMKVVAHDFEINRGKKGYGALITYLDKNNIPSADHKIHTAVMLMILSSIFGKSGFTEEEVQSLCPEYTITGIYSILKKMLHDITLVGLIMSP